MRTRRTRGVKQTRKGGNPEENKRNWETYWSDQPYNPYTKYPKGVKGTFYGTLTPSVSRELNMNKTYIIQRHGFSCANLQKVKDKKQNKGKWYAKVNPSFHGRVEDPSLTAYGIYSLLREEERPKGFTGTVYGSSLLRTWQTALLVYGKFGPLKIIVSPYIKEKHGFVGDLSNMPLPFEQQMAQMEQFMQFLKGVDHDIAREIIRHEHIIEYNDIGYPLPKQDPTPNFQSDYLESFKANVNTQPILGEEILQRKAYIPAITVIPEPSFREYYGAEGFVYFDRWVSKRTQATTIFVVSHSKWMQKVIEKYCGTVETEIFDENAWKLKITPAKYKTGAGVTFEIIPGVPKPTYEELDHMNRAQEPTCNVVPRPRTMPPSRPPPVKEPLPLPRPFSDQEAFAKQFAEESPVDADEALRSIAENVEIPYRSSQDPFPVNLPVESVVDQVRPRSSFLKEVTTVPIQSKNATTEPKVDLTRSFTELVQMLSNPGIAQGLSELIDSPKELKTKVLQYVYSNPSVETEPRGMFARFTKPVPMYLLQNHYLAFVLMYNPYFDTLVKELDDEMLSHFKITSSLPSVISFLKELRILIDTDPDLYQALVSIFKVNANQHYSFEAPPKVYAFTLLDLLLYEMLPLTVDKIKIMYPFFIDLVRNGARFSKIIYSDIVTEVSPRKMPKSELKPLVEVTQFELQQQWEDATRRIDPRNELSQYNELFRQTKHRLQDVNSKVNRRSNTQMQQLLEQQSSIVDQLADIKRRYREAVARLDPTQELAKLRAAYRKKINDNVYDYLFEHLVEYVPLDDLLVRQEHNAMLRQIKANAPEIAVSIGGLRGTSWKRSSLRQSSVKAGRYRASLYKGKRRTRANRS